jgi:hypothetical protein
MLVLSYRNGRVDEGDVKKVNNRSSYITSQNGLITEQHKSLPSFKYKHDLNI